MSPTDGLVREAVEELHADVEARHAKVTTAGALGEVEGDPALLKIAVCNLISNGIEYVPKDVTPALEISVRVTTRPCCCCSAITESE